MVNITSHLFIVCGKDDGGNNLVINCLSSTNNEYIGICDKKLEIRIPYVPLYNDNQIEKISEFVSTLKNVVKVRVLPYQNYTASKYKALGMKNTLPELLPTNSEITKEEEIFN